MSEQIDEQIYQEDFEPEEHQKEKSPPKQTQKEIEKEQTSSDLQQPKKPPSPPVNPLPKSGNFQFFDSIDGSDEKNKKKPEPEKQDEPQVVQDFEEIQNQQPVQPKAVPTATADEIPIISSRPKRFMKRTETNKTQEENKKAENNQKEGIAPPPPPNVLDDFPKQNEEPRQKSEDAPPQKIESEIEQPLIEPKGDVEQAKVVSETQEEKKDEITSKVDEIEASHLLKTSVIQATDKINLEKIASKQEFQDNEDLIKKIQEEKALQTEMLDAYHKILKQFRETEEREAQSIKTPGQINKIVQTKNRNTIFKEFLEKEVAVQFPKKERRKTAHEDRKKNIPRVHLN